jgi:hypothetical protein
MNGVSEGTGLISRKSDGFPADGKLSGQKGAKQQRFDPTDPNAELWKGLPKGAQIHKTPKGYKLTWNLTETEAPVAVAGALENLGQMNDPFDVAQGPEALEGQDTKGTKKSLPLGNEAANPSHTQNIPQMLKSGKKLNLQENLDMVAQAGEKVLVPVAKTPAHLGLQAGRKLFKLGEKEVRKEIREEEHPSQHHQHTHHK